MNRSAPFVRILLPFSVGIGLGLYWPMNTPYLWWLGAFAVLAPLLLAGRAYAYAYRWVFGAVAALCLVILGYGRTVWTHESFWESHFAQRVPQAHYWSGVIVEPPTQGPRWKVPVQIESAAQDPAMPIACTGKLLLWIDTARNNGPLAYGQRIQFRTRAQPAAPPRNPHAFDYGAYLARQQIFHTATIGVDSVLLVVAEGQGLPWWHWAYQQREHLLNILAIYFPDAATRGIAAGLLTGFKADLPDEIRQAYMDTGSMHALAVSGSHIVFLYTGLLWAFGFLRRGGRWGERSQLVLILAIIWGFTLVTGATPAVLRASVMFTIYMVGHVFYRSASVWNLLAASAFGLLAYNPYWLADVGFQLSYAAVLGMVVFLPILQEKLGATPPALKWFREVFLTGVAAQLGTLPLTLYYFHQFPVYFWLAGWVVVGVGALFLWGGLLLLVLHALSASLAALWAYLLRALLAVMNAIIVWVQHLPGSTLGGIWISAGEAVLWAVAVIALAQWAKRRDRRAMWVFGGALTLLGLANAVRFYHRWHQQDLIIYAVSGHTLVDVVDGETALTLRSADLPARAEEFAAKNNRWALGIRERVVRNLGQDTILAHVLYREPVLQYSDKVIAHCAPDLPTPTYLGPVWLVWVSDNAEPPSAEVLTNWAPKHVVLDGSNRRKTTFAWEAAFKEAGTPVHTVYQAGAWQMSKKN